MKISIKVLIIAIIINIIFAVLSFANENEGDGLSLIKQSRYTEAIEYFNRAIESNEDNPALYILRGHAYWKSNQQTKALQDFKKARSYDTGITNQYLTRFGYDQCVIDNLPVFR
jgi:tetratricopeptide (TPR) repeat protein